MPLNQQRTDIKILFALNPGSIELARKMNRLERKRKKYIPNWKQGVLEMRKKNVRDWFRAMLSLVFYIGLFGGISYLLQITIL